MILKLELAILLIGGLIIVGLITIDSPDWHIFGVNIAVLGAILIFIIKVLYWVGQISRLPAKPLHHWQRRKDAQAHAAFHRGIALFLDNQSKSARTALRTSADHPAYSRSANLLIAKCALDEKRFRAAHEALEKAREAGAETLTTDLLEAQAHGDEGQHQRARACLKRLRLAHPHHPKVTALYKKYFDSIVATSSSMTFGNATNHTKLGT